MKEIENVLVIKEIIKLKGWGRYSSEIKFGCQFISIYMYIGIRLFVDLGNMYYLN